MMSQCLPRTPWWGGRRTLLIPKIGAGCARPLELALPLSAIIAQWLRIVDGLVPRRCSCQGRYVGARRPLPWALIHCR